MYRPLAVGMTDKEAIWCASLGASGEDPAVASSGQAEQIGGPQGIRPGRE
jgi:hypothetical protein